MSIFSSKYLRVVIQYTSRSCLVAHILLNVVPQSAPRLILAVLRKSILPSLSRTKTLSVYILFMNNLQDEAPISIQQATLYY